MSRRLAQRKRAPGFIHLPPPSLSRPVSTSTSSCSPLQHELNPTSSGHAGPHDSTGTEDALALTQPVSIPAASSVHQRVSSPYYSPSQIFPTSAANKSYFPAYLSQSISSAASSRPGSPLLQHHHHHSNQQASTPSPSASTPSPPPPPPPLNIPPRTPRSPSFFGAVPSPLSQSSHPHSQAQAQSQSQSQAPSMSMTSSARTAGPSARTYHAHLAQQQLAFQMQQRDLIFQSTRATSSASGPISPRLIPLGSPGPVTPLTLEDNPAGYISASLLSPALQLQQHHLEKLAAAAEKAAAEEDPKSS
ncbi:hypothetical protein TWF192_002099 [Orbilia oligospora]|uniref:Uncharacterized protein n=1 Tax=Orbilia oligospora TaxID=2813651 RepID=A0A6G1LTU9_ORBOL|nr:hypothetical protein TWF191_002831 [Orbilia oligospora]KAF3233520.1 hypothetical protein TWF192_002099 [Orbilia oligospora]